VNTDSLRHLLALEETGSYSEAAALSGVTQPAVSLAVKKMESDLGVRLFERSGNRYVPTAEGRLFLKHAREILLAEKRLLSSLEKAREAACSRLRLAASNIPGEYVLPLILGDFKAEQPLVEPAIEVMDSSRVVESVRAGAFEIGFIGSEVESEDLAAIPFCPDTLKIICRPDHPLAGKKVLKPQRLAEERWLLREEGSGTRDLMLKALGGAGLDIGWLRVEMELGSTSAVISAVESGAGISMVSSWAAKGPMAEGRIASIHAPRLKLSRQFKLLRLKGRALGPAAEAFASFVVDKAGFFKRYARTL